MHDTPTAAEAEGPLYASAPQLVLLGLPKAGTSSVFSCLTSGAFRNPAPCCANGEKEPQFFRYNLGKLKELQLKNGTYMRRPGVLLLDFSTIYLAEAFWSIPKLSAVYASAAAKKALRFVLFLRDPTERALSNFCMFQPTLSKIVPRLAFDDMTLPTRPAPWWKSLSGLLQQANVTEEQLATAFPERLMGRDGGLNRTALAFVAKDDLHFAGRGRLRSMLLPWTGVCASESGWGWNLDAKSFEQTVLDEIRWVRDPATGCGQPPSAAATMTTPVLRDYVNRCHSPRNFMSTANLSVPVFQLALFLREFPDSHYTFFKYEQVTLTLTLTLTRTRTRTRTRTLTLTLTLTLTSSSSRACRRKRYGGYLRVGWASSSNRLGWVVVCTGRRAASATSASRQSEGTTRSSTSRHSITACFACGRCSILGTRRCYGSPPSSRRSVGSVACLMLKPSCRLPPT